MRTASHPPRRHGGIGQIAQSQRYIDAFLAQVNVAIVQYHVHFQSRMGVEKTPQVRHDMQPRQCHRPADAQSTNQTRTGTAGQQIGFIRFFDRAQRPFVEGLTGFGRRQPTRGSHQ